jgi:hypothetical protein
MLNTQEELKKVELEYIDNLNNIKDLYKLNSELLWKLRGYFNKRLPKKIQRISPNEFKRDLHLDLHLDVLIDLECFDNLNMSDEIYFEETSIYFSDGARYSSYSYTKVPLYILDALDADQLTTSKIKDILNIPNEVTHLYIINTSK